ncbi:maleylpyruvate isomerase family mycothiol-dependent enzyme [Catenulispora yoronensis]
MVTGLHGSAGTRITPARWAAVRSAVAEAGERFEQLVLGCDGGVMATADWTVADTAAHVAGIAWNYTSMVVSYDTDRPIGGVRDHLLGTTVDNIHTGLNAALLRNFPEREPARLVATLRASIGKLLELSADADPASTVTWLGGARLPRAGLLAHLTNEMLIHGRDIAVATGRPWRIPEEHAALFFELFIVEIIRNGTGVLLDGGRPRAGRIAVEFRSRYTAPVVIVVTDGEVSVEDPGGPVDARVGFRPRR